MWYSKILVAYDGSNPSHRCFDVVAEMAQQHPQVPIVFVHVVRLLESAGTSVGASAGLYDSAQQVLGELQAFADGLDNPTQVLLLKGSSPADLILRCAQDQGCDLIIMGSRGQGGVKGYLGSVSYGVVKDASACVLIAKEAVG